MGSGLDGNKGLHSTATLGSGNNIAVYLGDTSVQLGAQTSGIVVETSPKQCLSEGVPVYSSRPPDLLCFGPLSPSPFTSAPPGVGPACC